MGKLIAGVVVVFTVLAALVGWDKHQRAQRDAEYQQTLLDGRKARTAIADRHRVAAVKKLGEINAAITAAKASPRVTARVPLEKPLPAAPALTELDFAARGDTVVVGISQPEEVKVVLLSAFQPPASRYLDDTFSDNDTRDLEGVEDSFQQLEQLQYALLFRVFEVTVPASSPDRRFVGGTAAGDGALYELATGQRLGAFPFEVVQRDTATVDRQQGDVDQQLLKTFTFDVSSGARAEFTAFLENKSGRAAPGAAADESLARFAQKISLQLGLPYAAAGIRAVEVTQGSQKPIVTIRAEQPKILLPGGKVAEHVTAEVKSVLGTDAEVRVVLASP